jgi:hypothetical protein
MIKKGAKYTKKYTRYTEKMAESLENTTSVRGSTPVYSIKKPLILLGFSGVVFVKVYQKV